MSCYIRLRAEGGGNPDRVWESVALLRVGRLETLEVALDDPTISRQHAQIRPDESGWLLQDLGSTNGTFVNGSRVGQEPRRLSQGDRIRFGGVSVVVEGLEQLPPRAAAGEQVQIEAYTRQSWADALEVLADDPQRLRRPGRQLLALLRAGHHLGHVAHDEEFLRSVLADAVAALDAQRGAILLADSSGSVLRLRARVSGPGDAPGPYPCSHSLAQRSFARGESILYSSLNQDAELAALDSVEEGNIASALCVLLRTPRTRLGVLHLDRGLGQRPFTRDDLHLADALGASVSAGIECAQLWRKQQEMFLNTVTALAQAIEMRDHCNTGRAGRVTRYALLLGRQMGLSHEDLELLRIGAPLHNIGKIGIDDVLLTKPTPLTAGEHALMQTHTVKGAAILNAVPELVPAIPIARSHHERWDGRGYPDGLAGEAIPLLARVVGLAQAFDSMTSDRPYRRALNADAAFAEVKSQSGRQFDPTCVTALLAVRGQIAQELRSRTSTRLDRASVPNDVTLGCLSSAAEG